MAAPGPRSPGRTRGHPALAGPQIIFPNRALRDNIEGWVSVSFTVNEEGAVIDPVVLEASPPGVFDEASLEAASRFRFNPRLVNGVAVQTPDVRYVFTFNLGR